MHVFGPFDRYPLASERAYTVAEAPVAAHERMKREVGLERTVFVQASGHGTDNRAMLRTPATPIGDCSVPVVIDHMGMPDAVLGLDQPVFQTVLALAAAGTWVKLAGADRITRSTGRVGDAAPFMRALAQAAPQRL